MAPRAASGSSACRMLSHKWHQLRLNSVSRGGTLFFIASDGDENLLFVAAHHKRDTARFVRLRQQLVELFDGLQLGIGPLDDHRDQYVSGSEFPAAVVANVFDHQARAEVEALALLFTDLAQYQAQAVAFG